MDYMIRYGSAMNFFGGQGESAHKFFVKAPGLKKNEEQKSSRHKLRNNITT